MSWLRIFEDYRNLEAEKLASDARAAFLQDQVSDLLARNEILDDRAQTAQVKLLEDREKVADMFAVRVMEEGVYDPTRQHPAMKRLANQAPMPAAAGPQRLPAHMVAREMAKKAFADDEQRMREEAREIQRQAEEKLGMKLGDPEGGQDAAASAG